MRCVVKINKTKKIIIMTIGIIFVLILWGYAAFDAAKVRYEEYETVHYSYNSKCSIDYKVYLKPNKMYQEEYLGAGRFYIFKYVNYVDLILNYQFKANKAADLNVSYSAIAYLQGLHGNDEEVLWSKEYSLIPEKTEQVKDSNVAFTLSVPVKLDGYDQEKETLYLDSEINAPVVLKVVFNVHTQASTEKGVIEDNLSPVLLIPIGETVFKMEGEPVAAGENRIVENVKTQIPVDKLKLSIIFVISMLILAFVIFIGLNKGTGSEDIFEKTISGIFREYSERLAGMGHTISHQFSEVISVNSIEDMIKIADEIGQPVFYYKIDGEMERKIEFFVFDGSRTYYMVIFGEIRS